MNKRIKEALSFLKEPLKFAGIVITVETTYYLLMYLCWLGVVAVFNSMQRIPIISLSIMQSIMGLVFWLGAVCIFVMIWLKFPLAKDKSQSNLTHQSDGELK